VAIAIVLVLLRFVAPAVAPDALIFGMPLFLVGILGGILCGLAIAVWWLLFSRAPWLERLGAIALMAVALFATSRVVHESISNGMMGNMLPIYAIPVLGLALVISVAATTGRSSGLRRTAIFIAILLSCGAFTVLRTGGITGDGVSDLHWRWTETPEQRLLAETRDERLVPLPAQAPAIAPDGPRAAPIENPPAASTNTPGEALAAPTGDVPAPRPSPPAAVPARAEWPGFRGPERDGIVRGVRIKTDWSASPPVEMWRRPVGPGWSSFAVHGDLLYTQEQRGDEEVVACYRVSTGEPVWRHSDPVRFWESNGGAGPRGTPTISNGRVYAMGATGVLNVLDARDGSRIWSRNAATDTGVEVPDWGIASSPLVIDEVVVVAVSGQLVAYDARTGDRRWSGPAGGSGYSSPHLATIDGVAQILLLRGSRTISVAPADGTLLWEHTWVPGVGIVQPALAAEGDVLISNGDGMGGLGIRRLAVAHGPSGWTAEERWTSRGLKPYFNDLVVHKGHAFGFDGSILACIDLGDGARKWKGGRYGNGQLVLLPDQDVLLVLSEEGELALVGAIPDQFKELARFPAIEGKTWNHPVLVRDVLLVRNGEEMVAFRLSLASLEETSEP
jgi:hypothetical protein